MSGCFSELRPSMRVWASMKTKEGRSIFVVYKEASGLFRASLWTFEVHCNLHWLSILVKDAYTSGSEKWALRFLSRRLSNRAMSHFHFIPSHSHAPATYARVVTIIYQGVNCAVEPDLSRAATELYDGMVWLDLFVLEKSTWIQVFQAVSLDSPKLITSSLTLTLITFLKFLQ